MGVGEMSLLHNSNSKTQAPWLLPSYETASSECDLHGCCGRRKGDSYRGLVAISRSDIIMSTHFFLTRIKTPT